LTKPNKRQCQRRDEYLAWRESAARQFARKAGPLGRLTRRPEDFYRQLDIETIKTCRECEATAFPDFDERPGDYAKPRPGACHYCGGKSYVNRDEKESVRTQRDMEVSR